MDKILLTGSNGFIGRHFKSTNKKYRKVVRRKSNHNFEEDEIFKVDALDSNTDWDGAFYDVKSVIHLAGPAHKKFDYGYYEEAILKGTVRLAEAAAHAGVKRFIFISTILVHGNSSFRGKIGINSPVVPANDFAYFKYKTELALQEISNRCGMEVVIVRPALVYGKGAPGNLSMLHRFVYSSLLSPFGCLNNKRSLVSVNNLVDLIELCIEHPLAPGKVFLASESPSISTKDLVDNIAKVIGKKIYHIPVPVVFFKTFGYFLGKSRFVENLIGDFEIDASETRNLLGWTPVFCVDDFF